MSEDKSLEKRKVLRTVSSRVSAESNRRGFLRRGFAAVSGGLPVLFGLSQESVAIDPRDAEIAQTAAEEYASTEAVQEAVRTHATELLQRLVSDGLVRREAVTDLPVDRIHRSVKSYADSTGGVFVFATASDGEPTVKVQLKRPLSAERQIVLVVAPRSGKSQAFIEGSDSDTGVAHYTSTTDDNGDVTVQNCEEACGVPTYECGYSCNPYGNCGCTKFKIRDSCTDPDCLGCYVYDYSCCGEYECS